MSQTVTEEQLARLLAAQDITLEDYHEMESSLTGLCAGCGTTREMTETDAMSYPCPACGDNLVFGPGVWLETGKVI